ncbi:hypothetical protein WKW80_27675 [Variovorax humicola]|uniref:Uncharacterized protein n=1 Tax=Variovorax humicola TaxID=1769758 RepID=A0ABU8W6T5_9BURK
MAELVVKQHGLQTLAQRVGLAPKRERRLGDAVTHPGDSLDTKALLEIGHLPGDRGRVARVTGEHLHRDREALGRADPPEDDLWIVALAIMTRIAARPTRNSVRSAKST